MTIAELSWMLGVPVDTLDAVGTAAWVPAAPGRAPPPPSHWG